MDSKSLKDIFMSLNHKINKVKNNLERINEIYDPNLFLMKTNSLEKIYDIIKDLNFLIDKSDELLCLVLYNKHDNHDLTIEEKEMIRQYKLNEKIISVFGPFILYARICLESQYNN